MSVKQQVLLYRAEFQNALTKKDGAAAMQAAVAYASLLRGMAKPPVSYMECAYLMGIADRYERAALHIKGAGGKLDDATLKAVCQIVETGTVAAPTPPPAAPAPKPTAPAPKPTAPATPKAPTPPSAPTEPKKPTAPATKLPRKGTPPPEAPAPKAPTPPAEDDPIARLFRGFTGLDPALGGGKGPTPPASPAVPPARTTPAEPIAPPPAPTKHVFEGPEWSADVFERYRTATVIIRVDDAVGTGFFFREDGYILTNHHVAHLDDGSVSSRFRIENGDGSITGEAEFIKADKRRDVALLRMKRPPARVPFIPLEDDYSRIRPGMDVTIIGNGLNFGLAPINGTIKFTERKGNIVYTAPTNSGDSGSPVISRDGRCVGIHKSATVDAKGLSNGTPVPDILELLDIWLQDK